MDFVCIVLDIPARAHLDKSRDGKGEVHTGIRQ
jgi:hypothetical protein